jgi:hypothetical protein
MNSTLWVSEYADHTQQVSYVCILTSIAVAVDPDGDDCIRSADQRVLIILHHPANHTDTHSARDRIAAGGQPNTGSGDSTSRHANLAGGAYQPCFALLHREGWTVRDPLQWQ